MRSILCVMCAGMLATACNGMVDTGDEGGGGEGATSTATSDGGGGSTSSATDPTTSESTGSSSTSSSQPEGTPFQETIGCAGEKGERWPLAPFLPGDGEIDEGGYKINEAGAVAVRCTTPPSYPAEYKAFDFTVVRGVTVNTNGGACDTIEIEAVWFPSASLEVTAVPATAHFAAVDLAELEWGPAGAGELGERATVHHKLDEPMAIAEGNFFCRGVVLRAPDPTHRACVDACIRPVAEPVEHDFYSDTVQGKVACPGACPLAPLSEWPTAELGPSYGSDVTDLIFLASGETFASM